MVGPTRQFQILTDDDDTTLLKVAFASSDGKVVDQHFGSAISFAVFGVDLDQHRLLTVTEFEEFDKDNSDDKLVSKLALLEGCIAVYCRACGASAVRQLLTQGVQPVKVSEGTTIEYLLESLQQELREGPSSWLAKAIQRYQLGGAPFDGIEAETWLE